LLTEPDFEEGRSATASDGDRVWVAVGS
jgi:hypothetical protein